MLHGLPAMRIIHDLQHLNCAFSTKYGSRRQESAKSHLFDGFPFLGVSIDRSWAMRYGRL